MQKEGREEALILVKALPQTGKHGETVCCAGVTRDLEWRRQYPIKYRHLTGETQFKRWDWIEYSWRKPADDPRKESRRVQENSIRVVGVMPERERANVLSRLETPCVQHAAEKHQSLTLIRPREARLISERKSQRQVEAERAAYAAAANQGSFFDKELKALDPCPFEFRYRYKDDGGDHESTCGDWETSATFWRECKKNGETSALKRIEEEFGQRYPREGMAFVMGTHSRRPQWLLIGVLRLDAVTQLSLL